MVCLGGLETGDGWRMNDGSWPQNNKDPVNPDNGLLKSAPKRSQNVSTEKEFKTVWREAVKEADL